MFYGCGCASASDTEKMNLIKERPRIILGVTSSKSLILLRGLADRLEKSGFDVHVVASDIDYALVRESEHIKFHDVPMERKPSLKADVRSLLRWFHLTRNIRPDITMIGTPKASLLGTLAAFLNRVPVRVYHVRGLRLETETGMARTLYRALERLTFITSTIALAVSPSLKARIEDLRLNGKTPVVVLGAGSSNGIDTKRFYPKSTSADVRKGRKRKLSLDGTVPTIGFVGRLTQDKGVGDLVSASNQILQANIPHDLMLVGAVEDESIKELLIKNNLTTRPIVWIPEVKDVAPLYDLMDVFCLPTYREGFPNVVLEAGASGLPTVTTTATGAVDSVRDGVTGVLVPTAHSYELAQALGRLLEDSLLRKVLGAAARQWIEDRFPRDKVQTELVIFLQSQLARSRSNGREEQK